MVEADSIELFPTTDWEWQPGGLGRGGSSTLFHCAMEMAGGGTIDGVNRVVERLGRLAEADRAWMFRYHAMGTLFRNTHEWCQEGLMSHVGDLQDVPTSMIAWLQRHLVEKRAVMVGNIDALPRCARELRAELKRQKVQSVLSVPIFHQGALWGCMGYDAVRQQKRWGEEQVRLVWMCGQLIAAAEERREPTPISVEADSKGMIYLSRPEGSVGVKINDIIGVKAEGDYTRVFYPGGSALQLRPLKTWIGLLPKEHFQQIHRGSIINVRRVEGTSQASSQGLAVILAGSDEKWLVSRTFRSALRSRLGI